MLGSTISESTNKSASSSARHNASTEATSRVPSGRPARSRTTIQAFQPGAPAAAGAMVPSSVTSASGPPMVPRRRRRCSAAASSSPEMHPSAPTARCHCKWALRAAGPALARGSAPEASAGPASDEASKATALRRRSKRVEASATRP
jgi:hypothetical protein